MAKPLALVTGGGNGIGADICRAAHADGYRVAVLDAARRPRRPSPASWETPSH